jgi:hypothetical protein
MFKPQYFHLSSHVQPLNRVFQLRSITCAHFEGLRDANAGGQFDIEVMELTFVA